MTFDRSRYLNWQNKINTNKLFRYFVQTVGIYIVIPLIFGLAYLIFRDPRIFKPELIAFAAAWLFLTGLIDYFYKKPRPYQQFGFAPNTSRLMSPVNQNPDSFPSKHVIAIAAMSVVAWPFSAALALTGLVVAAIIGFARVILGYHYPADIFGALTLGVLTGMITLIFTK